MKKDYAWRKNKENNVNDWDNKILAIDSSNFYQTNSWAKYKEFQNWTVSKFTCYENNKNIEIAYLQIFTKKYFKFIEINYTSGLIVIDKSYIESSDLIYLNLLKKLKTNNFLSYTRIKISSEQFKKKYYNICSNQLSAPQTVIIDTNKSKNRLNYSHHHKRKFKKISTQIIWSDEKNQNNLNNLIEILKTIKSEKSIPGGILNDKELNYIVNNINSKLIIGYIEDNPVAGCLVYIANNWAIYASGGVTQLGRQYNLGYQLIEKLIIDLNSAGINKFDFGGIDINNNNVNGVNRFKLGFGGNVVENDIQIEDGKFIIRYLFNKLVGLRKW